MKDCSPTQKCIHVQDCPSCLGTGVSEEGDESCYTCFARDSANCLCRCHEEEPKENESLEFWDRA